LFTKIRIKLDFDLHLLLIYFVWNDYKYFNKYFNPYGTGIFDKRGIKKIDYIVGIITIILLMVGWVFGLFIVSIIRVLCD